MASGPNGMFVFGDRTTPANYGVWYRDGNLVFLNTNEAGNLWQIDPTTGQMTQPGWTAATLNSPWANFGSGWATAAYRFDLPTKRVNVKGFITAGGGTAALALPVGMRPPEGRLFSGAFFNGQWSTAPFYVDTAGNVVPLVAVPAGNALSIECSYQI
jgi:hypothetical protein